MNYGPSDFEDADDQWWDEDVFLAETVRHVQAVTNEFLTDHDSLGAANDERRYWDRVMWSVFTGENITQEAIPPYLTPDKDRGDSCNIYRHNSYFV